MGKRGLKPGQLKNRPRTPGGQLMPIFTPQEKAVPTDQVIAAVKKRYGMLYQVAEDLGVTPKTMYNYKRDIPEVAEVVHDQDERVNDMAEVALISKIKSGDIAAIIWRLKTKAKDRGYIERTEHMGKDGVDIQVINVVNVYPTEGQHRLEGQVKKVE